MPDHSGVASHAAVLQHTWAPADSVRQGPGDSAHLLGSVRYGGRSHPIASSGAEDVHVALDAAEATGDRDKIGLFDGIIYDDHQAFHDLGYPAVDLIDFYYGSTPEGNEYWHTLNDSLDKLSADSLLVTGRIVVEMLNRL